VMATVFLAWIAVIALGLLSWRTWRQRRRAVDRTADQNPLPDVPLSPGAFRQLVQKRQQIRRLLARALDMSPGCEPRVHHLMSNRLATVAPGADVAQVAAIMRDKQIRHLLVRGSRQELLGIISDRDIKERPGRTAAEIMTPDPSVVSPEMEIGPAITLMLNRGISCLPVISRDQLRGVLTSTDLLLSLQCLLQVLATQSAIGVRGGKIRTEPADATHGSANGKVIAGGTPPVDHTVASGEWSPPWR
jgi:CBS domain-containing protein